MFNNPGYYGDPATYYVMIFNYQWVYIFPSFSMLVMRESDKLGNPDSQYRGCCFFNLKHNFTDFLEFLE